MKKAILSLLILFGVSLHAQDKLAYQLFDKNGKKVTYKKMLKAALDTEVVLFGECHNNAISHWYRDWETDRKSTRLNSSH